MTYRPSRIHILLGTRKGTYVVEGNARRTSWKVGRPAPTVRLPDELAGQIDLRRTG